MKHALIALCALAPLSALAQSEPSPVRNTFWILGPFGLEHKLKDDRSSVFAGLTTVQYRAVGGDEYRYAFEGSYMRYSAANASGFGYGLKALVGSGITAVAPSIAYVTRPAGRRVAFRVGLFAPIGNNVVPIGGELAIGFRF